MKGNVNTDDPVLVRMHAFNIFDDIYSAEKTLELHRAMDLIAQEGRGAIVMIRSGSETVLSAVFDSTGNQEHSNHSCENTVLVRKFSAT